MKTAGVLLINLGTPASTDPKDVRIFLRHFLSDQRVIDVPRPIWWPILHWLILPNRPKKSAKMYEKIWDAKFNGSPLLYYTQQVTNKLAQRLPNLEVAYAMSYSHPFIDEALDAFAKKDIEKITLIPMDPQFSTTTVGSIYDAIAKHYLGSAQIPDLKIITAFYQESAYIQALADSIQTQLDAHPDTEELIFSYHGIPKRYVTEKKDPYYDQCHITTEMTMERLDHCVPYEMTFQSKFGPGEWLQPATDKTIESLPKQGIHKLMVVTPSFVSDCLETLYEIDQLNRANFMKNGGTQFIYVPPMNDRDDFVEALSQLVQKA